MTTLQEPETYVAPESAAPVDPELMDGHRLEDGDLDTVVELPVPPLPVAPQLVLEPPGVRPPRFDQLWRQLVEFAETLPVAGDEAADALSAGDDVTVSTEPRPRGRVVTVFSPKGGAGTTTVVTNLAVLLAAGGKHRVCVVDLDLEFGDVSIMTGLSPARSLADAAGVPAEVVDEAVDQLLTPWQDGLDCVLAPVDPSAAESIAPAVVAQLLAELRMRYEYVVVDTPSQLTEHVLEALDAADHQVLLTTPQLPALKSLRLVIDTLQLLGYDPARRTVLLNQVGSGRGLDRDGVQQAINHPVAAVLPHSDDVGAAVDAGVPLAVHRRDHAVVDALATFTTGAISGELATRRRLRSRAGWPTSVRSTRVWRHRR